MITKTKAGGFVPLSEWVILGNCPWSLNTARIYARRALSGVPGFAHLPFRQFRKGGKIFVNIIEMDRLLFDRSGR